MLIVRSDTCSICIQECIFAFNIVISWVAAFSLICLNKFDAKRFVPSSLAMIWCKASKLIRHRSSRSRTSPACLCWNGDCIGFASKDLATRLKTPPRVSISSLRLCTAHSTLPASRMNFRALTIATHSCARLAALAVTDSGSIRASNKKETR